jgi:hypothetical protein
MDELGSLRYRVVRDFHATRLTLIERHEIVDAHADETDRSA